MPVSICFEQGRCRGVSWARFLLAAAGDRYRQLVVWAGSMTPESHSLPGHRRNAPEEGGQHTRPLAEFIVAPPASSLMHSFAAGGAPSISARAPLSGYIPGG